MRTKTCSKINHFWQYSVWDDPYTMLLQNTTEGTENYFCSFDWKVEYLTKPVYSNLIVSISINSVMFPFNILFNGFLVFIIFCKRRLRNKISNVIIGYLTITDLAIGAIVQPLFIATELCRVSKGCNPCIPDRISWFFGSVICRSSINHLIVCAWERYVAIKYSLTYEIVVTKNKVLSAIIASWFLPLLLDGILLLELKSSVPAFVSSVHFVFTFTILFYFYTVIYMESRRHQRQIKTTTPHWHFEVERFKKQELKMAKTVAIMIFCLLSCYATCAGISVGKAFFFPINLSTLSLWTIITSWQFTLVFINSLIKPLICGWRINDMKNVGKNMFLSHKSCKKLEINSVKTVWVKEKLQNDGKNNDESSITVGDSSGNLVCDTESTMNLLVKTTLKDPKADLHFAPLDILDLRHRNAAAVKSYEVPYHNSLKDASDSEIVEQSKEENERDQRATTELCSPLSQQNVSVVYDCNDYYLPGSSQSF